MVCLVNSPQKSMQLYMQEIGALPRLTPDEERSLARAVRRGDAEARQRLIACNLKLVVKIAGDYAIPQLPLADLIAEGNIGLIKAVDRFDPERGSRLSTYAAWWIRKEIFNALANQSRTVRLPAHMISKMEKTRRAWTSLSQTLGHEPSDSDLAGEMGVEESKVTGWRQAFTRAVSMDEPLGDMNDNTLQETLADPHAVSPYEMCSAAQLRERVRAVVGFLDPRLQDIILRRFGMEGEDALTLQQIGRRMKLTRERVRQLEHKALEQLKRLLSERNASVPAA